jgi:hypothetical protein
MGIGKKLSKLFFRNKKKKKKKKKNDEDFEQNVEDKDCETCYYYSCSESFVAYSDDDDDNDDDDYKEEEKLRTTSFERSSSSNSKTRAKKKKRNFSLTDSQPTIETEIDLEKLHSVHTTDEQKQMLKSIIAKESNLFDENGLMEESRPLSGLSKEIFNRILTRNGGPIEEVDFDPQVLVRHCRVAIENNPSKPIEVQIDYMLNQLEVIRKWRTRLNADVALRDYEKVPNQKEYFDLWPLHIHGNDAYGHLIFVEKISEVDVDYLKTIMSVDEALHVRMICHEAITELKRRQSKSFNKEVYKHIWVMDLSDIKWSSFTSDVRDALHRILKMCIEQYSDTLYRIIMVNTPVIFRIVYKGASVVIKPATRKKVRMLGATNHPGTIEYFQKLGVTRANAPPCAGGTNKGVDILDLVKAYSKEFKKSLS